MILMQYSIFSWFLSIQNAPSFLRSIQVTYWFLRIQHNKRENVLDQDSDRNGESKKESSCFFIRFLRSIQVSSWFVRQKFVAFKLHLDSHVEVKF